MRGVAVCGVSACRGFPGAPVRPASARDESVELAFVLVATCGLCTRPHRYAGTILAPPALSRVLNAVVLLQGHEQCQSSNTRLGKRRINDRIRSHCHCHGMARPPDWEEGG